MIPFAPSENDHSSIDRLILFVGAIDRAVAFLKKQQLPTGEFATFLASSPAFEDPILDRSPFVTTHVLHAIHSLKRFEVAEMARLGLQFLQREKNFGGLWRYYSRYEWKHFRIPPDLDDTACVCRVLSLYGKPVPRNRWIFHRNRDAHGRFLTWVDPEPTYGFLSPLRLVRSIGDRLARKDVPKRPENFKGSERFALETDAVPRDDVDPVVNVNVLLYLGDCAETKAVAPWLVEVLRSGPGEEFSLYYRNPLTLYYAISRAIEAGVRSLFPLKEEVVNKTKSLHEANGPLSGPLSAAFAANVMTSLAPDDDDLVSFIDRLLAQQSDDGSWAAETFYSGPTEFWGSAELTTALALEALAKFVMKTEVGA